MKRFVSYLYAVENQQKTQNAGFARIEQRTGRNRVEIHLRDGRYNGKKGNVYLYLRKDGILHGFLLGEIEFRGNQADFQFVQSGNNLLETDRTLEEMNGILIQIENQIAYLSQWDEEVIDLSTFQEWKEKPKQTEPALRKTDISAAVQVQPQIPVRFREQVQPQETAQLRNQVQPQETVQLREQMQPEVPVQKEESWTERWEQMQHTYPPLNMDQEREGLHCVKIELKDIRMLPKNLWSIMNNSFLIHGFFNYRYLVFGEMDQNWILGIPGVFQNQEHVMASIFGFPEFLPQGTKENGTEGFGYWYRTIKIGETVMQ